MSIHTFLQQNKRKCLIIIGTLLLLLVAAGLLVCTVSNKKPRATPSVTYSTDKPSEEKIDKDTYQWPGTLDEPKYIALPSIAAGGFIQKVGVDQNKQIAVTTSIYFAGWFTNSVKPGERGLSIIDGHVSGYKNDGIFKNIKNLQKGEEFTVELGNGTIKYYSVIGVTTVKTADAVNVLFSQNPKVKSQLNLITCGGTFNRTTKQYEQRVIVMSELLDR